MMTDQIDQYCDYLSHIGRKESTIITYRSILRVCRDALSKAGMETDAERIGENEIYYLIRTLDMSEPTVKTYILVLNGMIEHYTGASLTKRMRLLWNRPVRHRVFITTDDFIKLFSIADDREKVVLVLGAFMGLRRSEMQHIRLSDIRRDHILIQGKGHGKNGLVCKQPMPMEVRHIIDVYMRWRSSLKGMDQSEGRLLVHYDEKRGIIKRYADRAGTVSDMIRDLGNRAGIDVTCHSLRRLFCTNLYYGIDGKGGADLATVKELMRHANINTTLSCYIDVRDQEKEHIIRKFGEDLGRVLYKNKCIT